MKAKADVWKQSSEQSTADADHLATQLPDTLQRAVNLTREKGSSIGLTTLLQQEHDFTVHKGAFHDATALRYGWNPSRMPATCACSTNFSVKHAFSYAEDGSISMRRNEFETSLQFFSLKWLTMSRSNQSYSQLPVKA